MITKNEAIAFLTQEARALERNVVEAAERREQPCVDHLSESRAQIMRDIIKLIETT